ncbi:MAG: glycosyltransferase [Candidatus Fermentibacteria bacterium]|nr:glycosyltransferase [Candidatus Fermentibacteria bacterium]
MTEAAVVIPFTGQWSSVIPTLQALAAQTLRSDITIVLSIDGMEKPPSAITELVDICVNGVHKGPAAARNRGWKVTDANYILFTDSDCIPDHSWAQIMIDMLKDEYQAVKGVYSSGGTRLIQRLAQVEFEERYRLMARTETIHLADTYAAGFRRDWLERLGGFDESFPLPEHEDVDLSWRLTRAGGSIGFAADALVAHTHRSSWNAYFRMKNRRGKWRIMLVRKFPAMAVRDGYTPQTLKLQMLLSIPVLLSIFLIPFYPVVTVVLFLLFLLSSLPLFLTALYTDHSVLFFIPFFAMWRGLALFSGAVQGVTGRIK